MTDQAKDTTEVVGLTAADRELLTKMEREASGLPEVEPEEGDGAEAPEPEVEKKEQDDPDPKRAAALDKARTALLRDKIVPKRALDAMSEEDVLAAGEAAREREAERTRTWQQANERTRKKETDDGREDPAPAGQPSFNPKELIQPFVDEFGAEAAKPLQTLVEMVTSLQGQLQARQMGELGEAMIDARRQVGERFPALLDDETYSTVEREFEEMSQLPRWQAEYRKRGARVVPEMLERAAILAGLERTAKVQVEPSEDSTTDRRTKAATSVGAGSRNGRFVNYSTERLRNESLRALEKKDTARANEMFAVLKARQERAAKE